MLDERRAGVLEAALWAVAVLGLALAVRAAITNPKRGGTLEAGIPPTVGRLADSARLDSIAHAAERVAAIDPFRLSHSPSHVAYQPGMDRNPQAFQPPPPPPKPVLTVRGIFGAPKHWRAILLGLPGPAEPMMVQTGDTAGGLRVHRITRDTVFVRGMDTTWTLTVRGEWQP